MGKKGRKVTQTIYAEKWMTPTPNKNEKKNEEFFRRMNGTERAGVLKNEKLEMDISLFPFPDNFFLLALLLICFFLVEGNAVVWSSALGVMWLLIFE